MPPTRYLPPNEPFSFTRRDFVRSVGVGAAATGGVILGVPHLLADETPLAEIETNIADFMKVPKGPRAIPGSFPGRVVRVTDPRSIQKDRVDAKTVSRMFNRGLKALTGVGTGPSFKLFFDRKDIVGIKVNPAGAQRMSTHPELIDAVIEWLTDCGLPRGNIVIWDRFEDMLAETGYTSKRFPGVRIVGLQRMPEDDKPWRAATGVIRARPTSTPMSSISRRGSSARAWRATPTTTITSASMS